MFASKFCDVRPTHLRSFPRAQHDQLLESAFLFGKIGSEWIYASSSTLLGSHVGVGVIYST
jgi:hypothetical protein